MVSGRKRERKGGKQGRGGASRERITEGPKDTAIIRGKVGTAVTRWQSQARIILAAAAAIVGDNLCRWLCCGKDARGGNLRVRDKAAIVLQPWASIARALIIIIIITRHYSTIAAGILFPVS